MSFKECTNCGKVWVEREDALSDPSFNLIGYDADFRDLQEGLFLFNHEEPDCKTTLAVSATAFVDLHDHPMFATCSDDADDCEGICLRAGDRDSCPVECDCAFVQGVIRVVKAWPKVSP